MNPNLQVDGVTIPAFLTNDGRTAALARDLAGKLGWRIGWNADTRTAAILTTLPHAACVDKPWVVLTPPITSAPAWRGFEWTALLIAQFDVEHNERYARNQQGADETYCNIFVADFTRAMGAPVPQVVAGDGETPSALSDPNHRELDANAMILWLRNSGAGYGWNRAKESDAVSAAVEGKPAIATAYVPNGIGHMAVLLPERFGDPGLGPVIAQSGSFNRNRTWVRSAEAFGGLNVEYWTHD